jgi:hypothetical protein
LSSRGQLRELTVNVSERKQNTDGLAAESRSLVWTLRELGSHAHEVATESGCTGFQAISVIRPYISCGLIRIVRVVARNLAENIAGHVRIRAKLPNRDNLFWCKSHLHKTYKAAQHDLGGRS